jgi:hypothetical protein
MIKMPNIVSIKSYIYTTEPSYRKYQGILLAESYDDGNIIVLERIYPELTDLEVELAVAQNREKYPIIILDWGELYEANVPDRER